MPHKITPHKLGPPKPFAVGDLVQWWPFRPINDYGAPLDHTPLRETIARVTDTFNNDPHSLLPRAFSFRIVITRPDELSSIEYVGLEKDWIYMP
jgi:hypothetical protein